MKEIFSLVSRSYRPRLQ